MKNTSDCESFVPCGGFGNFQRIPIRVASQTLVCPVLSADNRQTAWAMRQATSRRNNVLRPPPCSINAEVEIIVLHSIFITSAHNARGHILDIDSSRLIETDLNGKSISKLWIGGERTGVQFSAYSVSERAAFGASLYFIIMQM